VKERLDYSCALFDAEGGLVANGKTLDSLTPDTLLTSNQHLICLSI
jgi:hypothetical protein